MRSFQTNAPFIQVSVWFSSDPFCVHFSGFERRSQKCSFLYIKNYSGQNGRKHCNGKQWMKSVIEKIWNDEWRGQRKDLMFCKYSTTVIDVARLNWSDQWNKSCCLRNTAETILTSLSLQCFTRCCSKSGIPCRVKETSAEWNEAPNWSWMTGNDEEPRLILIWSCHLTCENKLGE